MDLPRALQPWREQLSIFPQDLAVALGGIVDNLSLLIGPMHSPDRAGRGEPDGVGGIGRRGSFERLLATEWALADEAPLEFLRRVSAGELSFLEIAHQKPSVARQSIVLFDVGPDQRGGPRVVHLAVLILLAQRALVGRASFSWGFLQDDPCELYSDVNEESVRRLMQATSSRRAKVTDAERWQEALGKGAAEVWIVGGPNIANVGGETFPLRIEVADSYNPDEPWDVSINVFSAGKPPRSVTLPLPVASQSVRLIRDPFQVAKTTPKKTAQGFHLDTNIVFNRSGKQLFLRGAQGELLTIPIPNSPNVPDPPKPRVFLPPEGQVLAGVGHQRMTNRIAAVTQTSSAFFVHTLSKRGATSAGEEKFNKLAASELSWDGYPQLGTLYCIHEDDGYYFQDGDAVLYSLTRSDRRAEPLPEGVPSAYFDNESLFYYQTDVTVHSIVQQPNGKKQSVVLYGEPNDIEYVIVGPTTIVVWRGTDEAEFVSNTDGKRLATRRFEPGSEIIGGNMGKDPGVVVIDSSRTQISLVDGEGTKIWVTSPSPIRTVAAIAGCRLVAFITEGDELCVYAHEHKTFVLRLQMGAS